MTELRTRIEQKKYTIKFPQISMKLDLVYRIKTYKQLPTNDKEERANRKLAGETIKALGDKDKFGNVTINYYKLISDCPVSLKDRLALVDEILNSSVKTKNGDLTLKEFIIQKHDNTVVKNTSHKLSSPETRLLDSLSSYLLADDYDEIFTDEKMTYLEKKSCEISLDFVTDKQNNKKTWNIGHVNNIREIKEPVKNRWIKSNNYRINQLYSFDNYKSLDSNFNIRINRLIDKDREYNEVWATVDVDGNFQYNNTLYNIGCNKLYKAKPNIKESDYKKEYQFDTVLILEQDNKIYFYSQNIYPIEPIVLSNI